MATMVYQNIFFFQQENIEIPIPRYFIKEKLKVLKERERILAQIMFDAGMHDDEPVSIISSEIPLEITSAVIHLLLTLVVLLYV